MGRNQIHELQEMLVKESIFRVAAQDRLISIIDSIVFISTDKNEEYRTVSLVWNVFDHLKALALANRLTHAEPVWKHIFRKILSLALHSSHS